MAQKRSDISGAHYQSDNSRFNAATSTCVRQHTKQAERQLEEVLAAGPSTFFEYLKRRAAKATRDEFGVPIIDAVEQLSVQGAGLLSQLAAWEPRKRIPPHEALRSTFFDDLDPRCPLIQHSLLQGHEESGQAGDHQCDLASVVLRSTPYIVYYLYD